MAKATSWRSGTHRSTRPIRKASSRTPRAGWGTSASLDTDGAADGDDGRGAASDVCGSQPVSSDTRLGEHTQDVLRDVLGLDDDEIAGLAADGTI